MLQKTTFHSEHEFVDIVHPCQVYGPRGVAGGQADSRLVVPVHSMLVRVLLQADVLPRVFVQS